VKRVGVLAVVGCTFGGVALASDHYPHGLKPRALAFMRSVALPRTDVPPAVQRVFARHPRAGPPRLAATIRSPRGRLALWVAPLRGHGWCEGLQLPRTRFRGVNCHWVNPALGPFGGGFVGPSLFEGRAAVLKGRELRLRFEDGSSLRIPTNDGFYLYRVPDERLIRSEPTALVLRGQGRELARFPLDFRDPFSDRPIAGGGRRPGGADPARERRLLSVPTTAGPVALITSPSRLAPATCWWLWAQHGSRGGGCVRNDRDTSSMWSVAPVRLLLRGHDVWVLWGRAGPSFASLQLRYQDGRRVPLARRNGFFLHVVRGPQRVRGHRPPLLLGVGADGRPLRMLLRFAWAR
jgi:hypothetical protein